MKTRLLPCSVLPCHSHSPGAGFAVSSVPLRLQFLISQTRFNTLRTDFSCGEGKICPRLNAGRFPHHPSSGVNLSRATISKSRIDLGHISCLQGQLYQQPVVMVCPAVLQTPSELQER